MNKRVPIGSRPVTDPTVETWVRNGDGSPIGSCAAEPVYAARLTIDVTAAMRGRIKVAAFRQGSDAVADLLRKLLEREFPTTENEP